MIAEKIGRVLRAHLVVNQGSASHTAGSVDNRVFVAKSATGFG